MNEEPKKPHYKSVEKTKEMIAEINKPIELTPLQQMKVDRIKKSIRETLDRIKKGSRKNERTDTDS